jgi:hypothetical protein
MRQRCDETQLTLMSSDTQGTLYVWAAGAGPRSTFGTLGNLIPRALKAHAEVPVSKVEIELPIVGLATIRSSAWQRMVGSPGADQRRRFAAEALVKLLSQTIDGDRYPLSARIVALKEILGQLRPEPERKPLPPRRHYEPPSKGRYKRRG